MIKVFAVTVAAFTVGVVLSSSIATGKVQGAQTKETEAKANAKAPETQTSCGDPEAKKKWFFSEKPDVHLYYGGTEAVKKWTTPDKPNVLVYNEDEDSPKVRIYNLYKKQ